MTNEPSILDVMAEFLAAVPDFKRRELHVAEPVWRYLRNTYAKAIPQEAAQAMLDLPIVVDDDLTGGQWQIRDDGEVVTSGDMAPAPEGMVVFYAPPMGWLAIRKDLAEQP